MKIFTSTNRLAFRKGSIKSTAIFMLLFSFIVFANKAEAQSLYVTTGGTVLAQNTAVNIAGNAIVTTGATPLVGATVSVSSNFVTGQDVLGLNGAASGGITNSYNAATGVLTLSGSATAADYQATLQKVTYTNTSATPNTSVRVITFSLNAALPYTGNGHYFEFNSSTNISWTAAFTAANSKTYFGLQGYLATITSIEENTFVYSKINAAGWLGGSDAASEGVWKWVCGPEIGTQFWQGGVGGSVVGGNFTYWHSGQPDNAGGEHYLDFWDGDHWNDYPNVATGSIAGYVVEYGGMAGDPVIHISDFVTVDFAPKVSSLATTTGSAIKWYDAPAGGNLLSSTALLVSGNHYYASQTVNGCESTSRLDVVAALNLAAPVASAHTASTTQIVWNWSAVSGATGYKWGTTNVYASATDIPSGTSKTETGLTCNTSYTRYVWAYNATASCVSRPALLTQTTSTCALTTLAFDYTGDVQSFTVPAGITSVTIEAWGAAGGDGASPATQPGGKGGYSTGTLSVTAGDILYIYTGGQGTRSTTSPIAGGWNGGGAGYNYGNEGWICAGGGGASDIRKNAQALSNRVIVAGAGGGGGGSGSDGNGAGGAGGGVIGGDGYDNGTASSYIYRHGKGGTQSAGGAGATGDGTSGSAGSLGTGGASSTGNNALASGGGGGYYGGGGGSFHGGGGGGGSSYIGGVSSGSTTAGLRSGNGQIKITY